MAYILLGISCIPEQYDTTSDTSPTFFFFFFFNNVSLLLSRLLVKCSHTEAHCSKGPIHEAKRQ